MPVTAGGETNMSNMNYGNLVRNPYVAPNPSTRPTNTTTNVKSRYKAPTSAAPTAQPEQYIVDPPEAVPPVNNEFMNVVNNDIVQAAMNRIMQESEAQTAMNQQAQQQHEQAMAMAADRAGAHSAEFMNRNQGPVNLDNPEAASGITPDITNPAIPDPIPPRPTNRSQVVNGTAPIIVGPSVDQGGEGAGIGGGIGAAGRGNNPVTGRPFAMTPDDLRKSAAARLGL